MTTFLYIVGSLIMGYLVGKSRYAGKLKRSESLRKRGLEVIDEINVKAAQMQDIIESNQRIAEQKNVIFEQVNEMLEKAFDIADGLAVDNLEATAKLEALQSRYKGTNISSN